MQTFLPIADFHETAQILDYRRLGKQRVETLQILNALKNGNGWSNHPAVKMWRGYEVALIAYGCIICYEWRKRSYQDTCFGKICGHLQHFDGDLIFPTWFGDEQFHLSHKSNLIRKFPEYYGPLWPEVPNDLPYCWPV